MSDDIYDYFSGNASRKVEPIEDDDDVFGPDADDQPVADADVVEVDTEAAETVSVEGTTDSEPLMAADSEPPVEDAPPNEPADSNESKGGHWDFLAGMLGIGSGRKEKPAEPVAKPPKPVEVASPKPAKKPVAVTPVEEPVTSASADVGSSSQQSGKAEDDVSGNPDDDLFSAFAGSSRPKPKKADSAESTAEAGDAKTLSGRSRKSERNEPSRGRREDSRAPRASRRQDRPKTSAQSSGDSEETTDFFGLDKVPGPEAASPLPEMFGADAIEHDDPLDLKPVVADADSGEDFIEFEIEELDDSPENEATAAEHGRRPRRRRSRGRGQRDVDESRLVKNKTDSDDVVSADSDDSDEGESADSFVTVDREPVESKQGGRNEGSDEGRDGGRRGRSRGRRPRRGRSDGDRDDDRSGERRPARSESSQSRGRDESRSRPADDVDIDEVDDVLFVSDDSDSSDQADDSRQTSGSESGTGGRRRKRRGRGRRSASADSEDSRPADSPKAKTRDRQDHDDDAEEEEKRARRGTIPTWQDAIDGLVDGNIKNHQKSGSRGGGGGGRGRGGQNRSSGGRGRGRSGSNQGNRGDRR